MNYFYDKLLILNIYAIYITINLNSKINNLSYLS